MRETNGTKWNGKRANNRSMTKEQHSVLNEKATTAAEK